MCSKHLDDGKSQKKKDDQQSDTITNEMKRVLMDQMLRICGESVMANLIFQSND